MKRLICASLLVIFEYYGSNRNYVAVAVCKENFRDEMRKCTKDHRS